MTKILALDVATKTGFALGEPGRPTRYGAVRLKRPGEDQFVASANMMAFLRDMWVLDRPDVIVCEAPMHPEGQKSPDAVTLQWGVVHVVLAMAKNYGMPWRTVATQSVRKHFTGRARWRMPGDSAEQGRRRAKEATIARCHALGLMKLHERSDDAADAIALHDYASHQWFRRELPERELVLMADAGLLPVLGAGAALPLVGERLALPAPRDRAA